MQCKCNKAIYSTRKFAKSVIKKQNTGKRLSTYFCPDGAGWHIGGLPAYVKAGLGTRDEISNFSLFTYVPRWYTGEIATGEVQFRIGNRRIDVTPGGVYFLSCPTCRKPGKAKCDCSGQYDYQARGSIRDDSLLQNLSAWVRVQYARRREGTPLADALAEKMVEWDEIFDGVWNDDEVTDEERRTAVLALADEYNNVKILAGL